MATRDMDRLAPLLRRQNDLQHSSSQLLLARADTQRHSVTPSHHPSSHLQPSPFGGGLQPTLVLAQQQPDDYEEKKWK